MDLTFEKNGSDFWKLLDLTLKKKLDLTFGEIPVWYFLF